ncbi:pentapeptide repeat-containing protein [Actinophytocola sediminis]
MSNVLFMVVGAAAIASGVAVFVVWTVRARRSRAGMENLRLIGTVLLAGGALALVTGWLLTGENPSRADALRTGGLAAGSIVALYALWLNDRRRRVDEDRQDLDRSRQELESARAEHDRERAADERFLRAVELLGSDADQVRVGALHALAGLARSRPAYTQDVLDVICSYLRRPFDHPRHARTRDKPWDAERPTEEADLWLQVRLTAQRLIADLLPDADAEGAVAYNLDLHGATLEYFDLSGKVIGQLRAREVNLYESNSLRGCVVRGPAWFTGGRTWGRLFLENIVFEQRSWFSRFTARGAVDLSGTRFHGESKFARSRWDSPVTFRNAVFDQNVDFTEAKFDAGIDLRVAGDTLTGRTFGMRVSTAHENHLPPSWHVDTTREPDFGIVRP